jgi:hypothetical protein
MIINRYRDNGETGEGKREKIFQTLERVFLVLISIQL